MKCDDEDDDVRERSTIKMNLNGKLNDADSVDIEQEVTGQKR